jgi:asparaginyl-tRNA synthetase
MRRWLLKPHVPKTIKSSPRSCFLQARQIRGNASIAALLSSVSSDASEPRNVTVNGFVRSVRKQKRVAFAALGDGTSIEPLQVVLTPEQAERYAR